MKKHLPVAMLFASAILLTQSGTAQVVSGNAFMQNAYVEMGINPTGTYISNVAAPAGYHYTGLFSGLGIIADSDKDGWAVGAPAYCGDYFSPGSPEEGFVVEANGSVYYNDFYSAGIGGMIIGWGTGGGSTTTTWKGTIPAAGLLVLQRTSLIPGSTMIFTTIAIRNAGPTTATNVFYTRNADPDNDQEFAGDFSTNNIVVQNHPVDPWAYVSATGLEAGCFFAMISEQTSARATYGGFSTAAVTPSLCYTGTDPWFLSGAVTSDIAIQITNRFGNIAPGQTKIFNFIYGTNQDDLDAYVGFTTDEVARSMEANLSGMDIDFNPTFSVSPNPSHGDINLYGYGFSGSSELNMQVVNLVGEVVYAAQLENNAGTTAQKVTLDNSLANGTYFVRIVVDGHNFSYPFVLAR
ncbi:MAG: T9SS type A sorting domain-containing protein [Chitinophagales bacterium]